MERTAETSWLSRPSNHLWNTFSDIGRGREESRGQKEKAWSTSKPHPIHIGATDHEHQHHQHRTGSARNQRPRNRTSTHESCSIQRCKLSGGLDTALQVSILIDEVERTGVNLRSVFLRPLLLLHTLLDKLLSRIYSTRASLAWDLELEGLKGLASFARSQLLDLSSAVATTVCTGKHGTTCVPK